MTETYEKKLKEHAEGYFESEAKEIRTHAEFAARNGLDIVCFEFQPSKRHPYFSVVTCGLANIRSDSNIEYVIASPFSTPEHSELAHMLAAGVLGRGRNFDLAEVIDIGRPWIYGSSADQLLVSLPYPYGPKLESADSVRPGLSIFWLMPIYRSEAEYIENHDVEALETMFDEAEIRFADAKRDPVA